MGRDAATGSHRHPGSGRVLKVADLVDDSDGNRRSRILALSATPHRNNRDHVDVIIALGMAKEGFDWIWCEHALTIGYRSSLTEIVQIIGRVTRDAPAKTVTIHQPDCRAHGRMRGGGRGERHPESHRCQFADGAGPGTAL